MHTKRITVIGSLAMILAIGSLGANWLVAGQLTGARIEAASSAPGTLPAADHRPPPWQVSPAEAPADASPMLRNLHEIARAVTAMVDGEVVKTVLTSRAAEKAFVVDPKDEWAAGDNWDYNSDSFRQVKQTLLRATYLAPGTVGCTLFMPSPVKPDQWHLLMNTTFNGKQMMTKADLTSGTPDPELLEVFHTGQRVVVSKNKGETSVLTPIYDSMGQIVAVVEVFTREAAYNTVRQ